jgi:hypothetical protein
MTLGQRNPVILTCTFIGCADVSLAFHSPRKLRRRITLSRRNINGSDRGAVCVECHLFYCDLGFRRFADRLRHRGRHWHYRDKGYGTTFEEATTDLNPAQVLARLTRDFGPLPQAWTRLPASRRVWHEPPRLLRVTNLTGGEVSGYGDHVVDR